MPIEDILEHLLDHEFDPQVSVDLSAILRSFLQRQAHQGSLHLQLFLAWRKAKGQHVSLRLIRQILDGEDVDPFFTEFTLAFDTLAESEHLPAVQPTRKPDTMRADILTNLLQKVIGLAPTILSKEENARLAAEARRHHRSPAEVLKRRLIARIH